MIIELTQGKFAIIDDEDFDLISQFKWQYQRCKNCEYAIASKNIDGKRLRYKMHRVIMDVDNSKAYVDHINGNGLDNRKENLRVCNHNENCYNRRVKNGYKGVSKSGEKFRARIKHKNKEYHLGYYETEIEAAKTYDKKAKELFGIFAKLNFS